MSPAAVEIRSPIDNLQKPNPTFDTNASSRGPLQDRQSMHPSSSSSTSSGLGNGAELGPRVASDTDRGFKSDSRVSGRVKPRLLKLRKPLHGGRARTAASLGIGSSFNPFASLGTPSNDPFSRLSSNGFSLGSFDANRVNNGNGVSNGNTVFVFGANGNDSSVNLNSLEKGFDSKDEDTEKKYSDSAGFDLGDDQNSLSSDTYFKQNEPCRPLGEFAFSVQLGNGDSVCDYQEKHSGTEFHCVPVANDSNSNGIGDGSWRGGVFVFGSSGKETLKTSDSKQSETEFHSVPPANDSNSNGDGSWREGVFVFGSSGKETLKTSDSKLNSDISAANNAKVLNSCPEYAFKLPDELRKLNINAPLNVRGGDTSEKSSEVNGKAAFVFSSCQKLNLQQSAAAIPPSSTFSFIAQSFQQNDSVTEELTKSGTTSTADGTGMAFTDFNAPLWDPSSLKENLFPEVGRKGEFTRKSRFCKAKKTKKVKEKVKQSSRIKQNPCQDRVQTEVQSQEELDSSGYYSPMEFSPYEDDTTAGKLPAETPVASSKPFCLNGHANACSSNGVDVASTGDDQESNSRLLFSFASGLEDEKAFTFSASSLSLRKLQAQKKTRRIVNRNLLKKTTSAVALLSTTTQDQTEDTAVSKTGNKSEKGVEFKQGSSSTSVIPDACEMWRLRGNQAYRNGDMDRAEACYTQGINSVPSSDNFGSYVKPLALCYSNRAAARISLGRLREALVDCEMAASLDPDFLKVYIRAANCHLVLGEVEEALQYFNKCVELGSGVCLDRRTTIEAAEGLLKAQKVAKCINQTIELLEKRTVDAAANALDNITEALAISSCSQKLLHMKAEVLFMVRRYKEVIELCDDSLNTADKNSTSAGSVDRLTQKDDLESKNQLPARLWRLHMIAKSHFNMGKLEMALDQLRKLQQFGSKIDQHQNGILQSSNSLAATISELLRCKTAGNEAVRAGRYAEAVEHYTTTLSKNVESRPFAAICFCNRAAANQALSQIADAIADCSLAMALDGNYTKAVSRRATLHEMIRDYGQAASDLQRLISILEKQPDERVKTSNISGGPLSSKKELRQARNRLSVMEEEAKKGIQLDLYLILGAKTTDAATDIKKAYRKAALRHHPDKAGQFLVRTDSGDEGQLWKEIAEEVHNDADRLFKMIGEAYAVLSDPMKRSEFDIDEDLRKAKASRESNRCSGRRKPADVNGYPFKSSPNRRNWRGNRKAYGSSPDWC